MSCCWEPSRAADPLPPAGGGGGLLPVFLVRRWDALPPPPSNCQQCEELTRHEISTKNRCILQRGEERGFSIRRVAICR